MSQIEQEWGAVRVCPSDCARAEAHVRARAAREGWDPFDVLVSLGLAKPAPKPINVPARVPREVLNAKPPALCKGGCGRMVGFTEASRQAGALYNAGRGMCSACSSREKRHAARKEPRYRPPAPCAGGCGSLVAFCKADVVDGARTHHGHGRCTTCAKRVRAA